MTPAEMITMVRDQTGTTTTNLSDAKAYQYLNIVYHDVENTIVNWVAENFFRELFTADTVADQSEYTLQSHTATQEWMKKIDRVEVKRNTSDDYHQLINVDALNNRKKWYDYVVANQSQVNAFFEYKDWSIFIYPAPENSVTNWLKIHAITDLIDLTSGDAESDVFPWHTSLRQFHDVLVLWTIPRVLRHRYKEETNASMVAQQVYDKRKREMVSHLNSIYATSKLWTLPNHAKYY